MQNLERGSEGVLREAGPWYDLLQDEEDGVDRPPFSLVFFP